MNKSMYKLLRASLASLAIFATPFMVEAQARDPRFPTGLGTNLIGAIEKIINGALVIVGLIAVLYIVIGGFRYVVSQGDDTATKNAKNTILYALIGLVVVFIAGAVVSFVFDARGV